MLLQIRSCRKAARLMWVLGTGIHQVEATKEGQFHGGHSFALERLLYVFWQLLRLQGVDGPEEQSADIFTQLSSLVSLRFLSQVACQLAEEFR